MPDFIRHSFSPTENLPALQFALDNLAQGKSVQLVLSQTDFQPIFNTLGLGISANLLSNGAKVAILSDDQTLLAEFSAAAQQQPWGELAVHFNAENISDYLQKVQKRKQKSHLKFPLPTNSMRVLQLCASQIQQHRQATEKWLSFRHKGKTYPELVTEYLQNYGQKPSSDKIIGLSYQFSGTDEQLQHLLAKLQEAEYLYQQLGSFQHPLNVLHDRFFRQNDLQLAQETAAETLEKVAFVVDAANRDAFTYLFKYEKWIEDHYTETFAHQNGLIEKLLQLCEQGGKLGKFVHDEEKSFGERVGGFFKSLTGKNKSLEAVQNELKMVYTELHKFQQAHNYVPHKFLNLTQENITFAQVKENLETYATHLIEWFKQKELLVRGHSKRLSRYEVHPHSNYLGLVHQFISDLDLFAEKLNLAKLLKINFAFNSENVSERVKQLEVLQKNIQNLRDNWDKFADYFNLKFFWLTLNEGEKKLILDLAETGVENWAYNFEAHLSSKQLAAAEAASIPQKLAYEKQFAELSRNLQQAKTELSKFILPHWRGLSDEFQNRKLDSLQNGADFNHFSTYFPLIFTHWAHWEGIEMQANSPAQLVVADIRGKSREFCEKMGKNYPLIVWIGDENSELLATEGGKTAIWREKTHLWGDDSNQQPFFEWLANQIKAQNVDIECFTNAEIDNFNGKIPLLLQYKGKKTAIFADFFTYTDWKDAYMWELYTRDALNEGGISVYKTYTSAWRENPVAELTHLLTICG